jgi:hypothetical protein
MAKNVLKLEDIEKSIYGDNGPNSKTYDVRIGDYKFSFASPTYNSRIIAADFSVDIEDENSIIIYNSIITMALSIKAINDIPIEEIMRTNAGMDNIKKIAKWFIDKIMPSFPLEEIGNICASYLRFITENDVKIKKIKIENVVDLDEAEKAEEEEPKKKEEKDGDAESAK